MTAKDKIDMCNKASDLLTQINNCDDWYFADFMMDVLSTRNVRALDEAKAAILSSVNGCRI